MTSATTGANGTGAGGAGAMSCTSDSHCSTGGACIVGVCVPPPGPLTEVAIEIRPPSTRTPPAVLTEILHVTFPHRTLELQTETVQSVAPTFSGTVPVSAHVVYTLPSAIPGQPALLFEADLIDSRAALALPASLAPNTAEIRLLPLPNADVDTPPFSFPAPQKSYQIPDARFAISGALRDAFGAQPGFGFDARAYQNGRLISNRPVVVNGEFTLIIPDTTADLPVDIEIIPTSGPHPSFRFTSLTPRSTPQTRHRDLGTITLATYETPQGNAEITVVGDVDGRPPVARALVRALTTLETTAQGATRYQREATTDAQGSARLQLLPGVAQRERSYEIRVIPEAGSDYRTECRELPVTNSTGRLLTVLLRRRPQHRGRVLSAAGGPVAGVTVKATRLPGGSNDCSSPVRETTSVITRSDGRFSLPLDPGPYQLDYEPRAGSPFPRLTEFLVMVEDPNNPNVVNEPDIRLRAGALVDGLVHDAAGLPVAHAIVRIYQVRCMQTQGCVSAPHLLAEVQTDEAGRFRTVMAVP